MQIGELFRKIYKELKEAKIENAHLESSWIIEKYTNLTPIARIQNSENSIEADIENKVYKAVERRKTGEPLAYILEEKEFYGRNFFVDKNVLIPRPETELLVDWALRWAQTKRKDQAIQILDLGTGSGCVGLSLLCEIPQATLTALDNSSGALAVAKKNAERLGLTSRTEFILLDAARAGHLMNRFDIIVANPPYIAASDPNVDASVKKHEPHEALYSTAEGLADISAWLKASAKLLKLNSVLGFEIGATQGEKVLSMFRDLGIFSKQYIIKDYNKLDRIVCGEKP